jgi:hypothetical protein
MWYCKKQAKGGAVTINNSGIWGCGLSGGGGCATCGLIPKLGLLFNVRGDANLLSPSPFPSPSLSPSPSVPVTYVGVLATTSNTDIDAHGPVIQIWALDDGGGGRIVCVRGIPVR